VGRLRARFAKEPQLVAVRTCTTNEIPKVVFSDSLASADWDETTIAAGDLAEAITRLKQERSDGYLLAHGEARFARSLVETGLIDEYRLVVQALAARQSEPHPLRLT
jgi:dihydrofolate reductase